MLSRRPLSSRRPAGFIDPCLPTLAHTVPDGPLWAHEIKHDGYRLIGRRDGDRVRLFTRRGHDWTDRAPAIAEAIRSLPVSSATIDGEAVVCDSAGISDFDRLRGALARRGSPNPFLFAFDILELDGCDLRPAPWATRRAALERVLAGFPCTWTATVRPCSAPHAPWDWRGSYRSDATGPTARDARRTGSRSRARMRQPQPGSWNGSTGHAPRRRRQHGEPGVF